MRQLDEDEIAESSQRPLDGVVGGAGAQAGYVDVVRGHEFSWCENRGCRKCS